LAQYKNIPSFTKAYDLETSGAGVCSGNLGTNFFSKERLVRTGPAVMVGIVWQLEEEGTGCAAGVGGVP